jgi:hypothetical protein
MKIAHKELKDLLQKAYSAEKAAAFAYQGHCRISSGQGSGESSQTNRNRRMEPPQGSASDHEPI